jgi:hypothetical protein
MSAFVRCAKAKLLLKNTTLAKKEIQNYDTSIDKAIPPDNTQYASCFVGK